MKLFNYIIILIFICNYIFINLGIKSLIFIWILLLCIFFISFFTLNLVKLNFKDIGYVLIIFKKVINLISLLTLFFNFTPNWILYIDYVVENGLEEDEGVNKAVDELGLTANQKYYLKIGCIITAVVLSIIFGYYITQNYEIFKPVENINKDTVIESEDLNSDFNLVNDEIKILNDINKQEKPINEKVSEEKLDNILDDVLNDMQQKKLVNDKKIINNNLYVDLKNMVLDADNEKVLRDSLTEKEYNDGIAVQEMWESLVRFRSANQNIVKSPLIEEITSENITYYETFMYNYYAYLSYMHKGNSVIAPEFKNLVSNTVEAYCKIPEVAKIINNKL